MSVSTAHCKSDAFSISSTARWGYLAICIICMVMIANLQYGWTLFVNPINKAHGWSIASIQFAFAIFIALETWLTPIEGWIVDILGPQRGPKLMVAFGGIMVAHRLGHQCLRQFAGDALSRRGRLRHRRRRRLRDLRRHGGEMVSRSARTRGRPDRGGLRRRRGAHRHSDPLRDRQLRLQHRFPLVRHRAGRASCSCSPCCCADPSRAKWPVPPAPKVAQSARSYSPKEVLMLAGVLAALHHVRHGVGVGPDGDGADRADRGRLQGRRSDRVLGRHHADRGADHRQSRQRRGAPAVRMDFRQYRA